MAYPQGEDSFDILRVGLQSLVFSSESSRLREWKRRCEEYLLLEKNGPSWVAEHFLQPGKLVNDVLSDAGFDGELSRAGFIEEIHTSCLKLVSKSLAAGNLNQETLLQIFDFIAPKNRDLRYPETAGKVGDAFLQPFRSKDPAQEILDIIKKFFLEHFGHPELDQGTWNSVSKTARDVMIRWVVQATFEAFFRLLDSTAQDDHWRYRRAFWGEYLKRGYISRVWLVLGDAARYRARRFISNYDRYGVFWGPGFSSDHSVLLFEIDNLIFSEWSHNGKCRVWESNDPDAPKRLCERYSREQLTQAPFDEFIHHHSESGSWQRKISETIRIYTGIHIPLKDLMP